jgi:hypothetical protein
LAHGTCFGIGHCEDLEGCGDIRCHPGLSPIKDGRMPLLSSATVLSLADSVAIVLSQAYQLGWTPARATIPGQP